jgi:hypothetical protein
MLEFCNSAFLVLKMHKHLQASKFMKALRKTITQATFIYTRTVIIYITSVLTSQTTTTATTT